MKRHRCPYCHGRGTRPLGGVYRDTLDRVLRWCRSHGFLVAHRAAAEFGCKPTALNNRLARLEALGYLVSEQHGRQRRFWPA